MSKLFWCDRKGFFACSSVVVQSFSSLTFFQASWESLENLVYSMNSVHSSRCLEASWSASFSLRSEAVLLKAFDSKGFHSSSYNFCVSRPKLKRRFLQQPLGLVFLTAGFIGSTNLAYLSMVGSKCRPFAISSL